MDKLLHYRFFRFLVCFVLVCAILINCSPLRAEATEIGIGITGIGVLFWFMLMFGGMAIEPTQDVLNDLDRAGQAYIDDWIVQAADDAAAASEALRKAEADLSEWISDPSNFTGDSSGESGGDDSGDPDWGIQWDENGNIVLGSMLGGALARWFADSILADGVEAIDPDSAEEGYSYFNDEKFPDLPTDIDYTTCPNVVIYYSSYHNAPVLIVSNRALIYDQDNKKLWSGSNSISFSYFERKFVNGAWVSPSTAGIKGSSGILSVESVYFTNYDLSDQDGNIYLDSSESSEYSIKTLIPSAYIGDIPSQVKAGTYDPDSVRFPAFDFSRVLSNQESALQEMRNLYDQIRNDQMSYQDFVQQIQGLPSPGIDTPDPSPSEPGETTPDETEPDEGEDDEDEEKDLDMFSLDLSDYFPFCIPFDLYDFFTCLNAEPVAPVIEWFVPLPGGGKYPLRIDLSAYDDVAQLLRRLQLLLFCVGLAFKTRDLIKG